MPHGAVMPNAYVPDELRSGPFTTRQGAALGVTASMLQGDPWRRMLNGVWVHRDVPDSRALRVSAVGLVLAPDAFVCGLTCAWMHGVDPWDKRNDLVWVGSPTGRRPRARAGCHVREMSVAPDDLCLVDGILMTVPVRTAYDCARWLARIEGVVVADALAHVGLIDRDELHAYVQSHRGVRNVRQADQVVELMDPRSESAMESRVRVFLSDAGLPRPESQVDVFDGDGRFVARLDFAYTREKVAIEYDGAWHWEQRRNDDRRRDALRALGWTVIVLSADDLYRIPGQTLATIRAALAAAA